MEPRDFSDPQAGRTILTQRGYWAFIPAPLPPALIWSASLVAALAEAERNLSQMATLVEAFPFPRLLTQPFVRREAVNSSRIEGTHSSLIDLYAYESAHPVPPPGAGDAGEVYNYVRALDYGLERLKTLPVSLRLIREMHDKLMENVRGEISTPGRFRQSQNWIGPAGAAPATAPYVPPPVDEMHPALEALEKFIHQDTEIPALIRIGMIHYQFEAIHPFLDGNGRVGRLLVPLLLHAWGRLPQPLLNLSEYIEHYRQEYYDLLLRVSQRGDWEAWLRFFLRGIGEQSLVSVFRMEQLRGVRGKYQLIAEKDRNPQRMAKLVDYLFSRPIFSIRQASADLKMPFKTAADYVTKLERTGMVREITGQARNRIFRADEILKALQSDRPGA